MNKNTKLKIEYVPLDSLKSPSYNHRVWAKESTEQLEKSIKCYGLVDPLIVNSAPDRERIIIGGNYRAFVARRLGIKEVPIVRVYIPDLNREKELCLRLNRNTGEFDWNKLEEFGEDMLRMVGFSSEEMDQIFGIDESPEIFDLSKELKKLGINEIRIKKGDVWQLGKHKMMCGDSTIESDVLKLMGKEKADMCLTDPPYLLNYLVGKKKHGKATEGFGLKRDRRYLETESLPSNFTDLWTANIAKIQKPDFSIMIFENPKNLRIIWNALEKHWTYRNTITWRLPNRVQNFAAKYKFFNKTDICLVGTKGNISLNLEEEPEELFQNEYENALFMTSGKPHWESYSKNKKYCPTDFIDFVAADEKSSGQGIIFGTKPLEVLLPYLKVLTKRGDLVIEPFGGSGSTLITAEKMGRRCYLMEKSNVYAEVIKNRFEKLTGEKAKILIHGDK
ncbi:MAG: DNA modification methylase [Parcubacteria group bacterium]|nr:DNA modification methylase [Parcubacteria group bacterium]